jgi:glycosyltransferase involved in cell wall biosynthesis
LDTAHEGIIGPDFAWKCWECNPQTQDGLQARELIMSFVVAIPVFNEERHVRRVLDEVRRYADRILVIDDGSSDGTSRILDEDTSLERVTHPVNRGYGAALISAFEYAKSQNVEVLITMDCDGQHEPARIPVLLEAIDRADIVSGSRYLRDFRQDNSAPEDRKRINSIITMELNKRYGLNITDAFCGFKAYRTQALRKLNIHETSWGMPLELWVQAAHLALRIEEVAVPRLYLDPNRAFGGVLDDAARRLAYYRKVLVSAEQDLGWHGLDPQAPFSFDHLLTADVSR